MEELEVLKQENAKLNARLAKAVEVFKEQKSNLDNLTSQVESLQKELETYKNAPVTDVSEYENKITLLEEDNIKLSEQNHLLEEKIQQNLEVSKSYNDQLLIIDKLTKQNEDLQKQLNEYELKLQDSETAYEQLHKKYEERKKQVAELMGVQSDQSSQIKKLQIEKSDLEVNINELNKMIESKDKAHKLLQETYNSVFNELNNLKETNTKNINLYNELKKNYEQQKEGCQKLEDACVNKDKEIEILKKDLADALLQLEHSNQYKQFAEAVDELLKSSNIITKTKNIENKDTSKKITVTKHTNSTGSQFMTDASGMNI